jgi:phosphatidate cytidylyltransferase
MTDKNRNLLLRVGSALVLFPLLVWVTWVGRFPFAAVCGTAAGISAFELTLMFTRVGVPEAFGVAVAALLPLAPMLASQGAAHMYPPFVPMALAFAAMALLVLNVFRPGPLDGTAQRAAASVLAWLYCGVLIAVISGLRIRFGFAWAMLAFLVTWLNDTLAYFAGRFFGRTRIYPRISPKKTWEGFAGGLVGSVLGAVGSKLLFAVVPLPHGEVFALHWGACIAIGLGAGVLGPLGDLAESMLKRSAGVKDSGHLIPGHGGLLDRIDALLFVGPWVYLWAALAG